MATTTTNFGWDIPQSTDLVKDGATAIAALGQDIDTALVDLKGGTTGQILSKASGTDLDYTWITNDVGDITEVTAGTGISGGGTSGAVTITNSMATAIDAKGDLVVGTGADTFSRLAVGTNTHVLTADSAQATGLKWAAAGGGDASYSLLNSGGTALSGTTTTISGISGMSSLMIFIDGGSVSGASDIRVRFNADSGSNYQTSGISWTTNTIAGAYNASQTSSYFCVAQSGSNLFGGAIWLTGGKSSGSKVGYVKASAGSTTSNESYDIGFVYKGTSAISSVSLVSGASFDAGTIYVYGSAV